MSSPIVSPQIQQILDLASNIDGTLTSDKGQILDLSNQVSSLHGQISLLSSEEAADQTNIAALHAQVTNLQSLLAAAAASESLDSARLDVLTGRRPMTVLSGLHKLPWKNTDAVEVPGVWIDSGGHTAQTDPAHNTTSHGTFFATQGTDTTPARPFFTPGGPWDNLFIYERFATPPSLPAYVSDVRTFSLTAADHAATNCIEWQQEFIWNGKVFNCGWQWNLSSKVIRYFDQIAQVWHPTLVPFMDIGTSPVTFITEHILDPVKGTTQHTALTINGARHPVGITQSATPRTGAANKYTISICQMDALGTAKPFGLNIHNCEARYIL